MPARNTPNFRDEPNERQTTPEEEEEKRGQLLLTLGHLARFFKTPIPFFFDLNTYELEDWVQVMNEIIRRENEANQKAMSGR